MLVGGILGYVFREKVHDSMEQEMQASIRMYGQKRAVTRAWDATQETVYIFAIFIIQFSPFLWNYATYGAFFMSAHC
jgi:hypothetical protein